jgi:hypothetical protein
MLHRRDRVYTRMTFLSRHVDVIHCNHFLDHRTLSQSNTTYAPIVMHSPTPLHPTYLADRSNAKIPFHPPPSLQVQSISFRHIKISISSALPWSFQVQPPPTPRILVPIHPPETPSKLHTYINLCLERSKVFQKIAALCCAVSCKFGVRERERVQKGKEKKKKKGKKEYIYKRKGKKCEVGFVQVSLRRGREMIHGPDVKLSFLLFAARLETFFAGLAEFDLATPFALEDLGGGDAAGRIRI